MHTPRVFSHTTTCRIYSAYSPRYENTHFPPQLLRRERPFSSGASLLLLGAGRYIPVVPVNEVVLDVESPAGVE